MKMVRLIAVQLPQILEMIRLDMQESKRHQEEDMEYCHIHAGDCHIQLKEDREEQRIQLLRAEDSNAQFKQISQVFFNCWETSLTSNIREY